MSRGIYKHKKNQGFQVGHEPYYRPKKTGKDVKCDNCGKVFYKKKIKLENSINNFCSRKCIGEWRKKNLRFEKHYSWKGDFVGYSAIHNWLREKYGKADKCDNVDCKNRNAKSFEWALIKGAKYQRRRENFYRLCNSCHKKYDISNINIKLCNIKN